jgi:hypothetical protein
MVEMSAVRRQAEQFLRQHRRRINDEIGRYPAPITACDAQFNHLLERRRRISHEIQCLNELMQAPEQDQMEFIKASDCLTDIEKQALRSGALEE